MHRRIYETDYVCIYLSIGMQEYSCRYVCMNVYMYVYISTYMYVCM